MSKILLIGAYSSLNKGDFAMQQALIKGLLNITSKNEILDINVLSQYPLQDNIRYIDYFDKEIIDGRFRFEIKYNELYNPLISLYRNMSSYLKLNEKWKRYDLIIDISGDSIGEIYGFLVTSYHILRLNFFGKENKLVFAPQSMGPFKYSSRYFKNVFNKAHRIYARDPLTVNILSEMNVSSVLSADLSFLLDSYISYKNKTIITKIKNLKELYNSDILIGLNCSFLIGNYMKDQKNVVHFFIRLIKILDSKFKNCLFVFIPHVYGPLHFLDDRGIIKDAIPIIDKTIRERMIIIDEELNHEEIKEIIKELDIVIGARMHLCIGSLSVGTPFLNLAYSQKSKGLIEDYLGLSECVVDIRDKNIDTLLYDIEKNLEYIIDKKEKMKNIMLEKRKEFSEKSKAFIKDLERIIYE